MKKTVSYGDYNINYYVFPGKFLNKHDLLEIHQQLLDMNINSGRNFKYGIFDHDKTFIFKKHFYDNIILAIIKNKEDEYCGFFYNYLVPESVSLPSPLLHQGLVVIYNNKGKDLLKIPYLYSNLLMMEFLNKEFFVSNISAVPLIVGTVSEIFDDVYPSIYSDDVRFSPKEYGNYSQLLYDSYVKKYFPDGVIFDKKRFVLKSPLKEMGFGLNIKELPRHANWLHNAFTNNWIDLNHGEDMVQIGKMTFKRKELYKQELEKTDFKIIGENDEQD